MGYNLEATRVHCVASADGIVPVTEAASDIPSDIGKRRVKPAHMTSSDTSPLIGGVDIDQASRWSSCNGEHMQSIVTGSQTTHTEQLSDRKKRELTGLKPRKQAEITFETQMQKAAERDELAQRSKTDLNASLREYENKFRGPDTSLAGYRSIYASTQRSMLAGIGREILANPVIQTAGKERESSKGVAPGSWPKDLVDGNSARHIPGYTGRTGHW